MCKLGEHLSSPRNILFCFSGSSFEDSGKKIRWAVRSEDYYKNKVVNTDVWKQYNITIEEIEVMGSSFNSYFLLTCYI